MTHGLAIICMVVLHLFCRTGSNVYGYPLLWINDTTPFVYMFGFFAEICVPLYSLAVGYAQELLHEGGRSRWRDRGHRILKLLKRYWVIVALFSVVGMVVGDSAIPGSASDFIKSLLLLHSYNGAWWYLHTYVLLLLVPPPLLLLPVKRLRPVAMFIVAMTLATAWYLIGYFSLRLSGLVQSSVVQFLLVELENLITILPAAWLGASMCRHHAFAQANSWVESHIPKENKRKMLYGMTLVIAFLFFNALHKSVLALPMALLVFLVFNLWNKSGEACAIWYYLGKHSTNVWLTHMFFYLSLFPGLVQKTELPLLMFGSLLALSLAASYVINGMLVMADAIEKRFQ